MPTTCYRPGQLIVLPRKGGGRELQRTLRETTGELIDIIYTTEDVLQHYADAGVEIDLPRASRQIEFRAYPFLARVPGGQERAAAERYLRLPGVAAAAPNFRVIPLQAAATLNPKVIAPAIGRLGAVAADPGCGSGVRIAILDTGIDASALPAGAVYPRQFDTDQAADPSGGLPPYDRIGHGTGVALVVNQISPGARLFSVKCMDHSGDLMALIAGAFLAQSKCSPHVFNFSLGLDCAFEGCEACGRLKETPALKWQVALIFASFRRHTDTDVDPLLVAAAGNNSGRLLVPAGLPDVLAVGAFDFASSAPAGYSRYEQIPADRFILAPGGNPDDAGCVGHTHKEFGRRPLFGTSFAAAFVSGIASRYMCTGACRSGCVGAPLAWRCLAASAVCDFPGYRAEQHGLGIVRYDLSVGPRMSADRASAGSAGSPFRLPTEAPSLDDLRRQVAERAYGLWEQTGQPADGNWQRARQELGIPDGVPV
jgi:hypothetical protein